MSNRDDDCTSCNGSGSQGVTGCTDCLGTGVDPMSDRALNHAYAEGRADQNEEQAAHLIDAWVKAHGKPIPWEKAVEIVAIVNKLSDAERAALLALNED